MNRRIFGKITLIACLLSVGLMLGMQNKAYATEDNSSPTIDEPAPTTLEDETTTIPADTTTTEDYSNDAPSGF